MTWQPGDPHEPQLIRRASGWSRWYATCECGWICDPPRSDKLSVMAEMERHILGPRPCRCYDVAAMEYGPPCDCGRRS